MLHDLTDDLKGRQILRIDLFLQGNQLVHSVPTDEHRRLCLLLKTDLVPIWPSSLRLDPNIKDPIPYMMMMLDHVRQRAHEFDVLHFHIDQFHFPLFRDQAVKCVTTLHGRQDLPDLKHLYSAFPMMRLISISDAQRTPIPDANFAGTVKHGLPSELHSPTYDPRGGYFAFLGRISPEKRVDRAIQMARAVGARLKIAAKVDRVDESYFREQIAPLIDGVNVEFIGEIDESAKTRFLGDARALLFPIDWPEPFGLVMVEAMACGTPVLAFNNGSVPEVIENGLTGYIVDSVEEGICALGKLVALDRRKIRRRFDERFSASRMARDYVSIYREMASGTVKSGLRHATPSRQEIRLVATV